MTVIEDVPVEQRAVASVVLALIGVALLVWCRRALRGTTLMGPWSWSLLAVASVATIDVVVHMAGAAQASWSDAARYAAATTLLCPLMALLGAKRPQHHLWHFIVLSLWAVLALPAAEPLLVSGRSYFDLHPARQWFLVVLILVGLINFLPTRFWAAAVLAAAAQMLLLWPWLPLVPAASGAFSAAAGLVLLTSAMAIAAWRLPNRGARREPLDCLWLEFRDLFGVAWALRVAERINALAVAQQWDVSLTWRGFRAADGQAMQLAPEQALLLQRNFKSLLRRFVSPEWIERRLDV